MNPVAVLLIRWVVRLDHKYHKPVLAKASHHGAPFCYAVDTSSSVSFLYQAAV